MQRNTANHSTEEDIQTKTTVRRSIPVQQAATAVSSPPKAAMWTAAVVELPPISAVKQTQPKMMFRDNVSSSEDNW